MRNLFEQGLVHYLTNQQLDKIQKIKIGIAGVGGLGSNIANILVRTGFLDFVLIDNDRVEASNLNRQNYFLDEIGILKIEATAKRLKLINPSVKINTFEVRLDKNNINKYFVDRDIIFEAFDNVESKVMFLEQFGNSAKLLILGNGMAGIKGEVLKVARLKDNIFLVGDGITELSKSNPPLAPRVVACSAMMASVALERVLL